MKLSHYRHISVVLLLTGLLAASYNWGSNADKTVNATLSTNSASVHTAEYLLQTAALLYEQKNMAAAKNILSNIDTASLTPDLEQNYVLQRATIALAENDIRAATVWLNESIVIDTPFNDLKKEIKLHELRAKVFSLKKQSLESAKEYANLLTIPHPIIKRNEQLYVDNLWEQLLQTNQESISKERLASPNSILTPWMDLQTIIKNDKISMATKKRLLNKWKKNTDISTLPTSIEEQ